MTSITSTRTQETIITAPRELKHKLTYWIPTGLLAALVFMSGTFNVSQQPNVLEALQHLGYPLYLATLLGTWKLLAVAALLGGSRWPRLKEWAFAGLFFNLTGAIVAHLAVNDSLAQSAPAALVLLLTGVTYVTHRRHDTNLNTSA